MLNYQRKELSSLFIRCYLFTYKTNYPIAALKVLLQTIANNCNIDTKTYEKHTMASLIDFNPKEPQVWMKRIPKNLRKVEDKGTLIDWQEMKNESSNLNETGENTISLVKKRNDVDHGG